MHIEYITVISHEVRFLIIVWPKKRTSMFRVNSLTSHKMSCNRFIYDYCALNSKEQFPPISKLTHKHSIEYDRCFFFFVFLYTRYT